MLSDSQLLEAYVRDASQDAFAQLVQRYLPLVYRSALRQLSFDEHRAQDVAQIVFAALARDARRLATHPHLSGWLFTTTRRTVCRIIRGERRRRRRELEAMVSAEEAVDADSQSTWADLAPVLDDALRRLSPPDREALLLRFFAQQSFAEVGAALRVGEDAARMRVARALEKLRARLTRHGVIATPVALASVLFQDAARGAPPTLAPTIVKQAAQAMPVAAGSAGGVIGFMAASKLTTTATAVAAVAAITLAVQQTQRAHEERAAWRAAETELTSVQERVQATATAAGSGAAAARTSARTSAATPPTEHDDAFFEAEKARGDAFLAAHPHVREALVRERKAEIRGEFLPLYAELELRAEQIAQFETLMIGRRARVHAGVGTLYVGDFMGSEERNRRVRELLGERGFERYEATWFSWRGESFARRMAESLTLSEHPMTPEQSRRVVELVETARKGPTENREVMPLILPRLGEVFSAQQLRDLEWVWLEEEYQAALKAAREAARPVPRPTNS
ncbi:MAG TPA: sigma-70 family RNA polymerase sigma factor [Candidatus Synoicihabitans sp.]|nr:sigma-70 family RNA polymerase sigma factor [Candidatus Synoicihabitans sp.]